MGKWEQRTPRAGAEPRGALHRGCPEGCPLFCPCPGRPSTQRPDWHGGCGWCACCLCLAECPEAGPRVCQAQEALNCLPPFPALMAGPDERCQAPLPREEEPGVPPALGLCPSQGWRAVGPGEGRLLTVGRPCPVAQALARPGGVHLHPFLRSLVVGVDVRLSKPQPRSVFSWAACSPGPACGALRGALPSYRRV